jgi:WD40 repeat protein/serine/threonine protein kinase
MQQAAPSVEQLFFGALELESSEARSAFLDMHCSDPKLRRRVEELLDGDAQGSGFLDCPAAPPTLTVESPSLSEGPGTVIGPYKLMEQIGEGGMGVVYVAEQTHPVRRKVALKIIKPGMDTKQVIARFEAERQALAMMDHPNIARVHDAGATESGRPYFLMELVRGIPITEYCDREQLAIPERLELFVLVCRAVQHAHQKGIIHRDLKPSNILVTVIDGAAVPKIIDFGVAKATGASLTERTLYTGFQQFVGTPLYMSPEQADLAGVDVDTRSDIYALGVLLYELLTGTTPFDRETFGKAAFDEMRRILREEEPPKPSTRLSSLGAARTAVSANRRADARHLDRAVRGELDWIVMKALEKDRRRRYETANDFAADVIRYLTGQVVEACPPSLWYRLTKAARRNRVALVMAALVSASLVSGVAVSTLQAVRAMTAERNVKAALVRETESRSLAQQRQGEAESEKQRAESLLAQSLIRSGTQQLGEGSALGLFDLIDAHAEAEHDPKLREASARLWAAGIAPLENRLAAVLDGDGLVAFNPDGMLIASTSGESVQLWETATWRRRGTPLKHGPGMRVTGVVFSPDGFRIATSTHGGEVRLWDVTTGRACGEPLRDEMKNDTFYGGSLAFSPDGKLLAGWSPNGQVGLWDSSTGKAHGPQLSHAGLVIHVAFSPDGTTLATGSVDATARLWDVKTGAPVGPPLRQEDMIHAMAFSPDGTLLATASGFDKTRLWEVPSGRLRCEPLTTADWVITLAFSPDSKLLATGAVDWTAILWDTATGRHRGESLRHGGRVTSVRFSPDGRLLATHANDGLLRLWDVRTNRIRGLPFPMAGHSAQSFSPDGTFLAVGHTTGTRVWQVNRKPWTVIFEHSDPVWAIDLSHDGNRLATASGSAVRIWEVATGRHLLYPLLGVSGDLEHFPFIPSSVLFSPDGALLAVIDSPKTVRLLDAVTGQPVGRSMAHPGRVQNLAFSPDGRRLATSTFESRAEQPTIRLFDTATQVLIGTYLHESLCLAMSPGGRQLAVGDRAWRARIWELADGLKPNRVLEQGEWCLSLDYSANGSWLATGTKAGRVHLWSASSGERRGSSVKLEGPVKKLKLSPDGRLLATATFDIFENRHGPVRLWDLTVTPPYPSVELPESVGTLSLALTADGRWLAIGQNDGMARLLRMPTLPETTREMQLRTWVALGTRASEGEFKGIAAEEWQALRAELQALRARNEVPDGAKALLGVGKDMRPELKDQPSQAGTKLK